MATISDRPTFGESSGVPIRDAATVLLLRDQPDLEVLMLQRNPASEWVSSAYLFPGGSVDEADHIAAMSAQDFVVGIDPVALTASGMGPFAVAAVRESIEEAGIAPISVARSQIEDQRWNAARRAVDRQEIDLLSWCGLLGVSIDLSSMRLVSRWITPAGAPRRYDTRFFLMRAPADQTALPDDSEVVRSVWVTAAEALENYNSGKWEMVVPTIKTLRWLSGFASSAEALEAGSAVDRDIEPISPRVVIENGKVSVLIPGDEGFEEATIPTDTGKHPGQATDWKPAL